jgi:O-antigen/teichoic acid export membrane protein
VVIGRAEAGRNPFYISSGLAAALAALTLIRFVILVAVLAPSEYGRLNIFVSFVNVAPALMSLGISWQYQRVARYAGPGSARKLVRIGHKVLFLALVPSLVATVLIESPFVHSDESLILIAICTVVISAATSLATLYSQIVLGLEFRSLASFMLFAVNGGVTLALLPILVSGNATILMVMGFWAIASLLACGWSYKALRILTYAHKQVPVSASFREGIFTLPALVGTFLLVFLARYLLGIYAGGATVASFSISSTVTESAFLISVSLVGVYSNKIMDGEHPNRSLLLAIPFLVGLTAIGLLVILFLLPRIADSDYSISVAVTAILTAAGICRLFISAWRARAVALRRVGASSWSYVVVGAVLAAALIIAKSSDMDTYALALTAAFLIIAFYQWFTVRSNQQPADGPMGQ